MDDDMKDTEMDISLKILVYRQTCTDRISCNIFGWHCTIFSIQGWKDHMDAFNDVSKKLFMVYFFFTN